MNELVTLAFFILFITMYILFDLKLRNLSNHFNKIIYKFSDLEKRFDDLEKELDGLKYEFINSKIEGLAKILLTHNDRKNIYELVFIGVGKKRCMVEITADDVETLHHAIIHDHAENLGFVNVESAVIDFMSSNATMIFLNKRWG